MSSSSPRLAETTDSCCDNGVGECVGQAEDAALAASLVRDGDDVGRLEEPGDVAHADVREMEVHDIGQTGVTNTGGVLALVPVVAEDTSGNHQLQSLPIRQPEVFDDPVRVDQCIQALVFADQAEEEHDPIGLVEAEGSRAAFGSTIPAYRR